MSAHAAITAVPAPAQLIPLFYFNDTPGNTWDTDVRITVPQAVGADTVIALLAGQLNNINNIEVDTSWSKPTGAFKPVITDGETRLMNEIHWYWMNNRSEEISNGIIPVSADDTVWISASTVAAAFGGATSGQAGYLILSNHSAANGGAPQFSFAADAWVENEDNVGGFPNTFSIPVLGLADDVDTTTYPTPTNNLIENFPASARGPIASPIHTGIRTSTTVAGMKYRVVDLPIHDNNWGGPGHTNTMVAWVDSNADKDGLNNGADGRLYGIGPDEEFGSLGSFSLPNQLNIVTLGQKNAGDSVLGIDNSFSSCGKTCVKAADKNQVAAIDAIGEAQDGGFLKFVINAKPLPNGGVGLAPGAYSSMIMFNVPGLLTGSTADEDAPNMAIDTGFFTKN
jgi:hypothetical protein